jgi:hypothetical protein
MLTALPAAAAADGSAAAAAEMVTEEYSAPEAVEDPDISYRR